MRLSWMLLLAAAVANAEESAIHAAARAGDIVAVRAAITGGAAVDARDEAGRTPLHVAASAGRDAMARELLKLGAQVNAFDNGPMTPTDIAVAGGNVAVSAILLEAGGIEARAPLVVLAGAKGGGWIGAARTLARCGEGSLPSLLALSRGENATAPADRLATVAWAIGPSCAPRLVALLEDREAPIRAAALSALASWPCADRAVIEKLLAMLGRERGNPETMRQFALMAWRSPGTLAKLDRTSKRTLLAEIELGVASADQALRQAAILAAAACGPAIKESAGGLIEELRKLGAVRGPPTDAAPLALWARAAIAGRGGLIANPYGRAARAAAGKYKSAREAIDRAIQWLLSNQREDGSWPADAQFPQFDVGVTGLAVLALVGAGEGQPFAPTSPLSGALDRALAYLLDRQDASGGFGFQQSRYFVYGHAIATQALAEALVAGGPPALRRPLADALRFIESARNPNLAWRYGHQSGENDSSVTRWMFAALRAGWFAGVPIDGAAILGALEWFDKMTDPEFGQVGYQMPGGYVSRTEGREQQFPPEKTQAMTAAGIAIHALVGAGYGTERSRMVDLASKLCAEKLPSFRDPGAIDYYYWYMATEGMAYVERSISKKWDDALHKALIPAQTPDGSWPAIDAWSPEGGPVYATAILVLSLEASHRDR